MAHRPFTDRTNSRTLRDVGLAAIVLAGSLVLLKHAGINPIGVVLTVCSAVPLILWRRFPLGVFVTTASASVLLAGLGYQIALMLGSTVALYLLAAGCERETPWTWRTTSTVVGLLVAFLSATAAAQGALPGPDLLHTGLAWAVAWFAGERTRLGREQIAEFGERALRAERESERELLLVAAEERARIARDLHDSAGHAISVIAVRAGAARLWHHQEPDRSLRALEAIEKLARETVEEIDHIVGTLREDSRPNGGIEAPAGVASLGTLIAQHEAAGLEITFDRSGTARSLRGTADQAAYRILQEALTNAARHGAGNARVELAFDDAGLELTVTNAVLANSAPRSGTGHGLIGMRERANLLGGDLTVARLNGTFRLQARIPDGGRRT